MTPEEMQAKLEEALGKIDQANAQVEEMKQRNQEMQSQMTVISEENARQRGIIQEFGGQPPARSPKRSEAPDPVTDPDGYADWVAGKVTNETEARTRGREEAERAAKAIRAAFFTKYPHLSNHQPLVSFYTNEVLMENPRITQDEGFRQVSERCDRYREENLGKKNAPTAPHVGSGGKAPDKKVEPETPKTEAEQVQDEIDSRRKRLDSKLQPPEPAKK
jgi:hypothetical protein